MFFFAFLPCRLDRDAGAYCGGKWGRQWGRWRRRRDDSRRAGTARLGGRHAYQQAQQLVRFRCERGEPTLPLAHDDGGDDDDDDNMQDTRGNCREDLRFIRKTYCCTRTRLVFMGPSHTPTFRQDLHVPVDHAFTRLRWRQDFDAPDMHFCNSCVNL